MLSGAAIILISNGDPFPNGGRYVEAPGAINRRVPVRLADDRDGERYVSLTTTRLHATTVYVVALVDLRSSNNFTTITRPPWQPPG